MLAYGIKLKALIIFKIKNANTDVSAIHKKQLKTLKKLSF